MARRIIGNIVSFTPIASVIGLILYTLSKELLMVVLGGVLVVDIVGLVGWFFVAGRAIVEKEPRSYWLGE